MDNAPTSPATDSTRDLISITTFHDDDNPAQDSVEDKISAYYSLAFPNFTYYLQTLTVTIGRRSVRPGSASSSDQPQVDVDLGPLKSVSRLHARIEYEEAQERFVLVVLGRNGAWVDGIWSGAGSRVPLGARSQIQIATRVFHFVLPPPPAPEDSPSPSSPSSTTRQLSPSIDITSLSPASSVHSPPASAVDIHPEPEPEKEKTAQTSKPPPPKANGKKRKKPGSEPRPPPPEVMPPRPQYTYAQLCYRAIKSMDGKATLQDICTWVADNFDWYRYNTGSGWESSIRHNLSSNRAFKKMERCAGERGKGFFWSVDPQFEYMFEEQDGKNGGSSGANKDGSKGKGKTGKTLDPPLKRSVKNDGKSPLPPPFASTPLPAFSSATQTNQTQTSGPRMFIAPSTQLAPGTIKVEHDTQSSTSQNTVTVKQEPTTSVASVFQQESSVLPTDKPSLPAIPTDVFVPIVIGQTSSTTPKVDSPDPKASNLDLNSPPIALRDNTIILNPTIFSSLTSEQLKELEALGAPKAIEILQSYIVRFLKERIKNEGAKSKSKKKSKSLKKKDAPSGSSEGQITTAGETVNSGLNQVDSSSKPKPKADPSSTPFTNTPLPPRKSSFTPTAQDGPMTKPEASQSQALSGPFTISHPVAAGASPPTMMTMQHKFVSVRPPSPPMGHLEDPTEEINIMDTDDPIPIETEPVAKRRRVEPKEHEIVVGMPPGLKAAS